MVNFIQLNEITEQLKENKALALFSKKKDYEENQSKETFFFPFLCKPGSFLVKTAVLPFFHLDFLRDYREF